MANRELTLKEKYFPSKEEEVIRKLKSYEESDIQIACVEWFRLQYPKLQKLLFAVPNGSKRTGRQGKRLKDEGMVAGVADLILLYGNYGYGSLCIEMKKGKVGRQSEAQKEWQKVAQGYGNKYVVVRTFDEFMKVINEYLK